MFISALCSGGRRRRPDHQPDNARVPRIKRCANRNFCARNKMHDYSITSSARAGTVAEIEAKRRVVSSSCRA